MAVMELIRAGKIELLEELWEGVDDWAWGGNDVRDRLLDIHRKCQEELKTARATEEYLAEEKPPAILGRADGLPR